MAERSYTPVLKHNVSSSNTLELLRRTQGVTVSSISICNTHATADVHIDLYIGNNSLATTYYIMKCRLLRKGETIFLTKDMVSFDNTLEGIYIACTHIDGSSAPSVDVIIRSK